jgi:hypothetical protein
MPMSHSSFRTSVHFLARRRCAWLLLLLIGFVTFLPNLGAHGLWDIDEAHNAECSREMFEAGNLVVPTFNYSLRTDKPAMLYWWINASYSLFGVSEWSARLPSVLAGLGSLLLCYEIGRRLFGNVTGLLAGCILASSFMFSVSSHAVTPDAILIFSVQLVFLWFVLAYDHRDRRYLVLAGLAAGMAMLTKGPVGIVLPGTVVLLFLFWNRGLRFLWSHWTLQAIGWCLLVSIPWYLYVGYETRWDFIKGFFLTHNLSRFNEPMEGHQGPFFYHLVVILVAFAPWSIFIGPTVWNSVRQGAVNPHGKPWAYRLLLCWIGVWFVVFSLAATKLPNYVLPTYPPLAMLTAAFLVRWWKQAEAAKLLAESTGREGKAPTEPQSTRPLVPTWLWRTSLVCLMSIGIILLVALPFVAGWIPLSVLADRTLPYVGWLLPLALVPILAGVFTWKRWSHHDIGWGIASVLIGSLTLTACLGAFGPLMADRERASKPLALELYDLIGNRDVRVGMHPHYNRPSMVFYLKRQVIRCKTTQEAVATLQAKVPTYMMVPAKSLPALAEQLGGRFTVHAERHDFTAGQNVVLISNQFQAASMPAVRGE